MLASITRWTDDAAGIEKTLRLFQGICTTLVGLAASTEDAAPWLQARYQLALGRRYFRVLKWHSSWHLMWRTMDGDATSSQKLLQVLKWFFLGSYFFLEMLTLTNAMRVTNYAWATTLQDEANKCWFYSIIFSILLSVGDLGAPSVSNNISRPRIYSQMAVDSCDLVIAGSNVGWISAGAVVVGVAYVISSSIAGRPIWQRVQSAS